MPHIKTKPFNTTAVDRLVEEGSFVKFRACSTTGDDELLGVEYKGEEFLLQIKPTESDTLIKYDKVTRPLKVNLIKEAIEKIAEELALEVTHSNIALSNTKAPLSSEYFKKIEDFESIDFGGRKISVEVGFGSGRHLLFQAKKSPDILFIGIEIHTPSAQQVLRQIELQGLENIWILNYDARLFMEMLPSNICHKIYVHFPVPWDKKPHRRVISKSFLEESMRVLMKEGQLELRTDSDNYFWYALETFFSVQKTELEVRKNEALEITSKYEERWLKQEKDIYDVTVKCKEISKEREIDANFNFNIVKYGKYVENHLPKEAQVFDRASSGYFVHFERIYKIGEKSLLIKCAFGSFDRPEHKYILLDEKGCRYFVSTPVKTSVNYLAHQKIMEFMSHG